MARNLLPMLRHRLTLPASSYDLVFQRLIATEPSSTTEPPGDNYTGQSWQPMCEASSGLEMNTHRRQHEQQGHTSRAGLDIISAQVRHEEGSRAAARMRKAGRIPGILFSLPGDASILVSMETKQVNTLVGAVSTTCAFLCTHYCAHACIP